MTSLAEGLNRILWGAPALIAILGTGIYLTVRLRFVQLTLFPQALKAFVSQFRRKKGGSGVSSFQAVCTALAATVGTGNLIGVAGAICLGGPGAIFWMWICGFLGMAVKYAEAVLAVRFRVKTENGWQGGPMYTILKGMGSRWKPLAMLYCLFGVVAAFGVGNAVQINASVMGINGILGYFGGTETAWGNLLLGIGLAGLIGRLLFGGAGGIGKAAERLVPFAAGGYILLCLGVLILRAGRIPIAFSSILEGAFSPKAVTGGVIGSAFQAMRVGCSRGVFTNEAGMGTASIAHGAANVRHPARQGLMGIMEVFLDTLVICSLTALVILVSGVGIPYGVDAGGEVALRAFSSVYGAKAALFLAGITVLLAVATVLGWGLYGARCAEFLFGPRAWYWFALAQTGMVVLGAVADTAALWQLAEAVNGLMVIPNLISLAALTPELCRLTKEYRKSGTKRAGGGNYANFHQRKPLRTFSHEKVPPSGCGSQEAG